MYVFQWTDVKRRMNDAIGPFWIRENYSKSLLLKPIINFFLSMGYSHRMIDVIWCQVTISAAGDLV